MALIAVRSDDGSLVEAFSTSSDKWDLMRKEPRGAFVARDTGLPLVLKRSIRGLQFFAQIPGNGVAKTEPMSEHHQLAQIELVRALRTAGYPACVEYRGCTPEGEEWQADVFCRVGNRSIAFEVQLAAQTLEAYEARNSRYLRSGVEGVWLVDAKRRYGTLATAIGYRAQRAGERALGTRPSLKDLAAVPFEVGDRRIPRVSDMRACVFLPPPKLVDRIALAEFALGVARGQLQFDETEWRWCTAEE